MHEYAWYAGPCLDETEGGGRCVPVVHLPRRSIEFAFKVAMVLDGSPVFPAGALSHPDVGCKHIFFPDQWISEISTVARKLSVPAPMTLPH